MKHLARCRVEAAKELLRTQADLSVTEIAFKSGFESTQYFATVFRHYAGCTPREFRASANTHAAR
jgi:AraC family L-rhamnose operon regulatory protein RhaS